MSELDKFQRRVAGKQSEGTARRYAFAIRRYRDWLDENGMSYGDADKRDIEDYLLALVDDGYSKGTLTTSQSGIKRFYDEMRDSNPAEEISISGWSIMRGGTEKSKSLADDVHYLEPAEIEKLVEHVHSPPKLRNELLIKLAFQTGLRRGELCTIKLRDIDRQQRSIRIHAEKTHSNRTVYYQPSLDTPLNIWIDAERNGVFAADESEYLFPTTRSEHISPDSFGRLIRNAAEDAGIQDSMYTDKNGRSRRKVTAHTLRHSFAVAAIKNGIDVRTLQKLMGHSNIETTERYLDLADDDIKTKARQFGPSLES